MNLKTKVANKKNSRTSLNDTLKFVGVLFCYGIGLLLTLFSVWKLTFEFLNVVVYLFLGAVLITALFYGVGITLRYSMKWFFVEVLFALILILALFWVNSSLLLQQATTIIRIFIRSWRVYYESFKSINITDSVTEVLVVFLVFMMLLEAIIVRCFLTPLVKWVVPAIFIILGLLVGITPSLEALLFLIGSILLMEDCQASQPRNKRGVIIVAILIIFFLIYQLFDEKMQTRIVETNQEFLIFQHRLERNLLATSPFQKFLSEDYFPENGAVDNKRNIYNDIEVLRVTVDQQPTQPMYFRGFTGNSYKNGNWSEIDENKFRNFAVSNEQDMENASAVILNFNYESQKQKNKTLIHLELVNKNAPDNYAYVPYFFQLDTLKLTQILDCIDDGSVFNQKKKQIQMVGYENNYSESFLDENDNKLENAYQKYAIINYTFFPKTELPELYDFGNTILKNVSVISSKNNYLEIINAVKTALWDNCVYNTNLKPLAENQDVVEYFLFTSKEGYCTHFATAATLLFRQAGIPARYVTGYVAFQNDFEKNDEGTYTASIKDSKAHAWTEIYIDGKGWYPVEVTPGYTDSYLSDNGFLNDTLEGVAVESSNEALNEFSNKSVDESVNEAMEKTADETIDQVADKLINQPKVNDELQEVKNNIVKTNNIPVPKKDFNEYKVIISNHPSVMGIFMNRFSNITSAENKIATSRQYDLNAESDYIKTYKEREFFTIYRFLIVLGMLTLGGLISFIFYCKVKNRKLQIGFQSNNYESVIKTMIYKLNQKIERHGIVKDGNQTDEEYLKEILKKIPDLTVDEINIYGEVMRKFKFSNQYLDKEDAEKCHAVYKKINDSMGLKASPLKKRFWI